MKTRPKINNKTVLITGATGLLGPKHAEALCEINFDIVLLDLNNKKLLDLKDYLFSKYPKSRIFTFKCDITKEKEVEKVAKKLDQLNQKVDVLINNAAINPKMNNLKANKKSGMVENYKIDELRKELEVNLIGSFICSKIFGSSMAKNKYGIILNIASDLSINAPDQSVYSRNEKIENVKNFKPIGYSLSKFGLIGLTKYLATYWGHLGVRCNALALGAVKNKQSNYLIKNIIKRVPLKRLATIDEYKKTLHYMCTDASSYMTGETIIIDGGRSTW